MNRKVEILVDETGIEIPEALAALKLTNGNLIDAIKYVKENVNINIIKALLWLKKAMFAVIVIAKRKKTIYELKAVVTSNPEAIEVNMDLKYFDFLSEVYSLRSKEGTHIFLTAHLEELLGEYFMENNDLNKIEEFLIEGGFEITYKKFSIYEVRLSEYLGVYKGEFKDYKHSDSMSRFEVNIGFVQGDFEVRRIKNGMFIYVYIDDEREIAKEIKRILGGYREMPLKVPIMEVSFVNGLYRLKTQISRKIFGVGFLKPDAKISVVKAGFIEVVKSLFR
ncbi:MAG: hypothetical protein NZ870_02745 [bacterium]|nr:hypothetical protein [bacterium]